MSMSVLFAWCDRVKIQDFGGPATQSDTKSIALSVKSTVNPIEDTSSVKTRPTSSQRENNINDIATIPDHIFAEDVRPLIVKAKLPEPDERLINTPQLAWCLGLLKESHEIEDILEPAARSWLQFVENDEDEQERLKNLAKDVIRTFKKEEIKDDKAVAEVVCLGPVIERELFRDLLGTFYDGVDHSGLLAIPHVQGIARLIQGANAGYLDADDLVKILGLLSKRLRETHQQSPQHMYELTLAASYVLDAMADTKVEGLDRETLHEPLSSYLDALKENIEPYLMYQAAYACQALLCVPDNETPWQATIRRIGNVLQGVSGLVSAAKGLDLNGFTDGLSHIQQGLSGVSKVAKVLTTAFDGVTSLTESGKGFLDGLNEGFSFQYKCAWYTALRGADTLIRDGEFASFKELVCEAPCRLDPAFQWGVCQRLGEVAGNPVWDARTRRGAVSFLGEIYRNDDDWGHQASVKEWILVILKQLSSSAGSVQVQQCKYDDTFITILHPDYDIDTHVVSIYSPTDALHAIVIDTLLQELQPKTDSTGKAASQASQVKDTRSYSLKLTLPSIESPSLLDRVQNKPDVEGTLRQLRKQRLKERGNAVYIPPQAKAGLKASDDQRFPLMEKVHEFLESDQNVFLLLGDSGAGKSTFNRQLECDLWHRYKKTTGRIPLFINLPAIDKPEQDMIAKQLRKAEFTEPEIREMKVHRKFILICDGYDESQQTHNLYMSNRLNQPGEWNAQMLVSCRSEYLGVDYRDRFQPGDRNQRSDPTQSQEAVITPFTNGQVRDYIKQYVSVHRVLWEAKDYELALELIPSLKELVRNPFLMTLSLEVLPRIMDPGEHLSATRVTRVALYDQFIEHWLERGKKRLGEKEQSPQAKAAFESLVDEGFTRNGIDFLKRLAVAIYKEQDGQPIVSYSRFKDNVSWKAEFFSREDEKQLLREACPLTRSGNQHRFIHRSLLEYGLSLAIFDPRDWKERSLSATASSRRGSTGSTFSFRVNGSNNEVIAPVEQGPDIGSPLAWRYFVNEPSILEFLSERVRQQPVFKQQLYDYIELSTAYPQWRTAAANAITILVRIGIQFNGADLRGIRIPGADLSYGVFEAAQLQDADLRQVNFRSAWLFRADLSGAQMAAVQFGELPFLMAEDGVLSCAYSPDGKSLALGLENGGIKMYSTSSWEPIQTLISQGKRVPSIAYSPQGNLIASGSWDCTVRIWDVEAETFTHALCGHSGNIMGVAFSPRGDTVASASSDNTVRLWDVRSGDCRLILIGHTKSVLGVVYSPKVDRIASGSEDRTVRLWDVEGEECLHIMRGHRGSVRRVVYSPQGDRVASASEDGTVRVWDVDTGDCCRVLIGHEANVNAVAYSPQGDIIASGGEDKTVRVWDAETGSPRQILRGHYSAVSCVMFSPRGDRIACGSANTVRLWDVGSGEARQFATNHRRGVLGVKYSPRGDQIASCSQDKSIRLSDAKTGVCHRVLAGHTDWVRSIAYSPSGNLIASGSNDGTVRLWDMETGACHQIFDGRRNYCVVVVAYSPRGNQIASGENRGPLRLWDLTAGTCHFALIGHTEGVTSIMYSPDGNQIASSSTDRTVRLWNAETGISLHVLSGHANQVASIAYSPLGGLLVSGSDDSTMLVWDVETGECRQISKGHTEGIVVVVYSPHGDRVASGSEDGSVRIWDMGAGECLHNLAGHTGGVTSVAYSSRGDRVVSGSSDKTVRLWDATSGQCRAVIPSMDTYIISIATSDDNCLAIGYGDGSVRMWQVIEDGDECHVRLRWRPVNGELVLTGTMIHEVHGLSQLNKQLLKQRGAVGEPFVLEEASKKGTGVASVVSVLKQTLSGKVPDPVSSAEHAEKQEEEGTIHRIRKMYLSF